MKDWRKTFIAEGATIRDAIRTIDQGAAQIGLVVDEEERLLGVVTDGDIRRAILRGADLQDPVTSMMKRDPVHVSPDTGPDDARLLMRSRQVRQVPILDSAGRVIDLVVSSDLDARRYENEVVLMAGGLGTRLGELTRDVPKPLLKVGAKPILETIMERFLAYGYYRFRFSVNYRADQIVNHFGDGSAWGAEISYVHETKRMGTAGALGLLEERPAEPFFVMNGDLLTKVDFSRMMRFHLKHGDIATVAVREYDFRVPFGVVEVEGSLVVRMVEKPVQRFFVNAGIYLLDPAALDLVPTGEFFDMPDLLQAALDRKDRIHSFPVHEYWRDVGRLLDLQQADAEYEEHFGEP